jgi:serine/threonine-protein kinase
VAEPADNDAPAAIGTIIAGRYELVRLLGAGAMGAVYQAKQLSMDRLVALKLMHRHVAAQPGLAPRFHREMKATSRIEHANTVRVFDYGADESGQLFLAMEFIDGRPLSRLVAAEAPLALGRIVHIGGQIARALGAAHAEGITHRDLKPDNVMLLDRYGEHDLVKVVDFGIARFAEDPARTQMTAEGAVIGTPAYMSPEQALGRSVDGRADFYSLGIMLYEMATGRRPFASETLAGMLVAHATETPAAPSTIMPVAPPLEALILRLLAKDPEARPQTAAEVLQLLEASGGEAGARAAVGTAPMSAARDSRAVAADQSNTSPDAVPAPLPTSPDVPRPSSRSLALPLVGVGLAALIAVAVVAVVRHRAAPVAPVPTPTAESTARARLDALFLADGAPLAPPACRADAPPLLDRLARAAALLEGMTVGAPRAQDREALGILTSIHDADSSAEYWALLSRARNAVEPEATGALQAAQRATARCPEFAFAHGLVGNAEQRAGDFGAAVAAYQQALALAPGFIAPRYNLGVLALRRGDPAAAVAAFDEVLAKEPLHPRARLARGQAQLQLKHVPQALEDFEQATLRHPEDAVAWRWLGQARERAGEQKGAREAFCKAKALGDREAAKLCP